MTYFLDLDEYTEDQLRKELANREVARARGKCDYCGRKMSCKPACKFPNRHDGQVSDRCEISASGGMIGFAGCDLRWGHPGDMHSNAGDGFYARAHDAEHHRRQKVKISRSR